MTTLSQRAWSSREQDRGHRGQEKRGGRRPEPSPPARVGIGALPPPPIYEAGQQDGGGVPLRPSSPPRIGSPTPEGGKGGQWLAQRGDTEENRCHTPVEQTQAQGREDKPESVSRKAHPQGPCAPWERFSLGLLGCKVRSCAHKNTGQWSWDPHSANTAGLHQCPEWSQSHFVSEMGSLSVDVLEITSFLQRAAWPPRIVRVLILATCGCDFT